MFFLFNSKKKEPKKVPVQKTAPPTKAIRAAVFEPARLLPMFLSSGKFPNSVVKLEWEVLLWPKTWKRLLGADIVFMKMLHYFSSMLHYFPLL